MKITIDNLDGNGAMDYTSSVDTLRPLTIQRALNAPTLCRFGVVLTSAPVTAVPVQAARVIVSFESTVLFTGYVSVPPIARLAGDGITGATYSFDVTAVSDELLLDVLPLASPLDALNTPMSKAVESALKAYGGEALSVQALSPAVASNVHIPAGTAWSAAVGQIAGSTYGAYRVLNGAISIVGIGSVTHTMGDATGTLQVGALNVASIKLLASDMTICGAEEPTAFTTELFAGDGSTKDFLLSEPLFTPPSSLRFSFSDTFQAESLNPQSWQWLDPSSHLSIGALGLTCSGGSGQDAQTIVSLLQQLELGGSVVVQLGGVQIQQGSSGLLGGLYIGGVASATCFAGFEVLSSGTQTQIVPYVSGAAAGSAFTLTSGHTYTLRIKLYTPETERVRPAYYYLDQSGVGSYGGDTVAAPGQILFEIQDVVSGTPGAPSILFSGSLATVPPVVTIGLLDSGALSCSIRSFSCTQGAPNWVSLTPQGASPTVQSIDTAANGGSCTLSSSGKLTFNTSSVPAQGAVIQACYRQKSRAVARRTLAPSTATAATSAAPTQGWIGSVTEPLPRSSVDCENAAAALLQCTSSQTAAWAGTYEFWQLSPLQDVWPGDLLLLENASSQLSGTVLVRKVEIILGAFSTYKIAFANPWAEEQGIKLSSTVPVDANLPQTPSTGTPLADPQSVSVTSITGSTLNISINLVAPPGGGFEVRRTDWGFGPGTDSNLVLRSPVPNISIPRAFAPEQFYIRMYDASTPPNYSRHSAAIIVNLPLD